MHDWSAAGVFHLRQECKYHFVMIPKYHREVFYGKLRRQIGAILRELSRQRRRCNLHHLRQAMAKATAPVLLTEHLQHLIEEAR